MESFDEQTGQMSQSSDASVDVATTLAVAEQDSEKPSSSSNQDTGVSNLGVLDV